MGLLDGKKAVIFGLANNKSIAFGIAKKLKEQGAEIAISYVGEIMEKRAVPLAEELGAAFVFPCDVTVDAEIDKGFEIVAEKFGTFDILVHSIAYAPNDALKNDYIETTREDFATALNISAYSLVALCKRALPLMNENGSVMTLSYLGAVRVVDHYNVMGVAKAALEASVRYLSIDMGKEKKIKVNAISAGPIKTLAASGVKGLKHIFTMIEERAPLRENVTQEDVGGTAVYLASDLSRGVSGQTIYVDGGYCIMGV